MLQLYLNLFTGAFALADHVGLSLGGEWLLELAWAKSGNGNLQPTFFEGPDSSPTANHVATLTWKGTILVESIEWEGQTNIPQEYQRDLWEVQDLFKASNHLDCPQPIGFCSLPNISCSNSSRKILIPDCGVSRVINGLPAGTHCGSGLSAWVLLKIGQLPVPKWLVFFKLPFNTIQNRSHLFQNSPTS